jgi:Tol biopolymer transport system component
VRLNPGLPAELERIINKCLEKDRNLRYQHASEIRADLQRLRRDVESGHRVSAVTTEASLTDGETARTPSSAAVIAVVKQHKWGTAAVAIAALMILGAAILGVYSIFRRAPSLPFQNFTVTKVTNSGNAELATISPDGRFVLSTIRDGGLESLWLRNVPTGSDTQIISPSADEYQNLAFSPDGNNIYFRKAMNAKGTYSNLYRVPILGGTPQTIVRDIDSDVALAPDGHRIAYIRCGQEVGNCRLLTSTTDGSEENILPIKPVAGFVDSVEWADNGKQLVYNLGQAGDVLSAIDLFDFSTGRVRRLAAFTDTFVRDLRWSTHEPGVFVTYSQRTNPFRDQLGFLPAADGGVHPITRDTNSYKTLTVSSDGRTLASVQTKATYSLYILPGTGSQPAESISTIPQKNQLTDFNWTADGDLFVGDGSRLLRIKLNGTVVSQIIADTTAEIRDYAACGAKYVVVSWAFHGGTNTINIWRANADGSSLVQLTSSKNDGFPICSPDYKWVYYLDGSASLIGRVAVDSPGKSEVVARSAIPGGHISYRMIGISPGGDTLAYTVSVEGGQTQKVALLDLKSQDSPRLLDVNAGIAGGVRFTPDGKSIAYTVRENGVDNAWVQPLDGTPGHPITSFRSDQFSQFHWSLDGKSLGILRGHTESDVVLLQESK